jgi:elongator complex protein 1
LQHLQALSELNRKFTINDDLKRYGRALAALHDIDDFEKLTNYTVEHQLYSTAIELYRHQPVRLRAIMELFASFLNNSNKYKEAAIGETTVAERCCLTIVAYEFLEDHASAMAAYLSANMWREALSCAGMLQLRGRETRDLANDLADEMEEAKDYQGAARICLDYLSDVERCASLLCKANQFQEAIRLVVLHREVGLLESVVDTGLAECFNSTTELLADCKAQIDAQIPRLRELRIKKVREPRKFDPDVDAKLILSSCVLYWRRFRSGR